METAAKPQYPQLLEDVWVRRAQSVLGARPLRVLRAHVADLSSRFTAHRPDHFSNYLRSDWSLAAYGLYFFPQSWVRLRYPLEELLRFRSWKPKGSKNSLNVLDLGAGLGAVGLSAVSCFYEHGLGPVHLHAVDHSPHALEALKDVHTSLYASVWPKSRLRVYRESLLGLTVRHPRLSKERFDLITMGFSFNESHSGSTFKEKIVFLKNCLSLLNTNGVLLMLEPALKETAQALRRLSDTLIQEGVAFNWGPYPGGGVCPLLSGSDDVWTHEVRTWVPPRSVQQVGQDVVKNLHELKFSFSALGRLPAPELPKEGHTLRLIAPVYSNKSMYLLKGVAQDDQIHTYELQKRDASKEDAKCMKSLERGDCIHLVAFEDLPPAHHHRLYPNQGEALKPLS